jgi:hypothetical protein
VAYPSGFTAKYAYTATGYLYQVSDNAAGTVSGRPTPRTRNFTC